MVAVGVAGLFAAVRPDLRMVEHIDIIGAQRAGHDALRHLIDVPNGTAMWSVDLQEVVAGAERHPWVRSAVAQRRWPATLTIEIEEHEPVAVLHYGDLLYVDASGEPFMASEPDQLDYPHVTGVDPSLESVHPDLPRLAVENALWLIDALHAGDLVARDDISEVAFRRSRGFTVYTGPSQLVFGFDGLERQVARLETLLRGQGLDLSTPTLVDLAPPSVAIVRPLDGGGEG